MRIAFHSNQLCLRGTEVAMFDYAHHNETILGNESVIITNRNAPQHEVKAIEKFSSRFPIFCYDNTAQLDEILQQAKADLLYCIKSGQKDQIISNKVKTVVHVVFKYYEPHGDVYAYVSEWLSQCMTAGAAPFVPHMIDLPKVSENLRDELGIPKDAIVFGRHGGADTFDLTFAHDAVVKVAKSYSNKFFIFLGTTGFGPQLSNIIHLDASADLNYKVKFINTCDAMLHARHSGETFGLSIGEFSVRNKQVITWSGSAERAHVQILGGRGIYYDGKEDLIRILESFKPSSKESWDCYSNLYNPETVMRKFKEVFIDQ